MDIIMHAHHADVSDSLRSDAEDAVRRVAGRWHRAVDAVVRFVSDGSTRRVEIALHRAHQRDLFVHANARAFRPALVVAIHRLRRQVSSAKRTRRKIATDDLSPLRDAALRDGSMRDGSVREGHAG